MCQTSASGISSRIPSAIPSPARKTGTMPTMSARTRVAAGPSGVVTRPSRVGRSAVASTAIKVARVRTS